MCVGGGNQMEGWGSQKSVGGTATRAMVSQYVAEYVVLVNVSEHSQVYVHVSSTLFKYVNTNHRRGGHLQVHT